MAAQFWADACNYAITRRLEDVTVAWGAFVSAAFLACAAASGCVFWLWLRLDANNRNRVWKYYGWFSGLMCFGCCVGAVSYPAWALFLVKYYNSVRPEFTNSTVRGGPEDIRAAVSYAQALRWLSLYSITYPLTLCSVTVSKLLVLGRLMDFVKLDDGAPRWALLGRVLVAIVVVGCIAGLGGSIAASIYFARAIDSFDSASGLNNMEAARSQGLTHLADGTRAASVLIAFDAIMLLLIVVAFSVVGVVGARRIHLALKRAETSLLVTGNSSLEQSTLDRAIYTGRQLRRQIIGTCSVAFVSFLIRAVFSLMFALAGALQTSDSSCPDGSINRCSNCYNVFSHILIWYLYSPDIFFAMIFVGQPLALLVVLWGMTSGHTLHIMKTGNISRRSTLL